MDGVRELLVDVELEYRATGASTGREQPDPRVLAALARVPRHQFVPEHSAERVYANGALAIGHGQTISQPFMVALMTELSDPQPASVVLEVGTGSGYQAAVLAELVTWVYSVEVVPELAHAAAWRLRNLGYSNVSVRRGDGRRGWPEHAPYDGIVVTAVAEEIPAALVDQLVAGGRLVIPIGPEFGDQQLVLLEKVDDQRTRQHEVLPVRFVPLVGEPGR